MENKFELKCICGAIIPEDNIEKQNRCNEEGEDWAEVEADCPKCYWGYRTEQWGEWEYGTNDYLEVMQEYINTIK